MHSVGHSSRLRCGHYLSTITDVCNDAGQTYATITDLGTPTSSDPEADFSNDAPDNDQYPIGTTTVTWTATNGQGRTATCTQSVTVVDCDADITCPPAKTDVCNDAGQTYATITDLGTPTSSDPEADFRMYGPDNDQYPIGTTTVTWTATNGKGRTATCTQSVTVVDCDADITCPPAKTDVCNDAGQTYATITDLGTPTSSDPEADFSNDAPDNDQYPIGTTTVTWTATNGQGRTATCTQSVTVVDCDADITCPPAKTDVCNDAGQTYATITDLGTPTSSDPEADFSNDAPDNVCCTR